jgi:hypothetical protein
MFFINFAPDFKSSGTNKEMMIYGGNKLIGLLLLTIVIRAFGKNILKILPY